MSYSSFHELTRKGTQVICDWIIVPIQSHTNMCTFTCKVHSKYSVAKILPLLSLISRVLHSFKPKTLTSVILYLDQNLKEI